MAVKIRLMRVGKKKQPTYRVVVADGRSPRDGRIIESIGMYGPREDPSLVRIDEEKALGWLRNGAQPTEQVQKLLTVIGVWGQYEQERGGPIRTKLARRGVETGAGATKPKAATPKARAKAKAAEEAAAAPAPPSNDTEAPAAPSKDMEEPAAEEPAAEAPAEEAPAAEETPAETPAEETPAEAGADAREEADAQEETEAATAEDAEASE